MLRFFILGVLVVSRLVGDEALEDSFEQGVPESCVAEGGELMVSTEHLQDGKQALRWDFEAGDAFVIRTGPLGNVNVWTGYGGYSRSALVLPLYLDRLGEGHLEIELRAGEETAATIELPLAHVGWQKLVYHYSWQSKMTWVKGHLRGKLDNLRISAHGIDAPTRAWFDAIRYNQPRDFRDARQAIREAWRPASPDFSGNTPPTAGQLAKVEELVSLLQESSDPKVGRAHWERRVAHHRGHIEKEGWHHGRPVDRGLGHYFGFLNGIARDWRRCADPAMRAELADCFHTVNDWLQEQGLVVNGALGRANNYVGRTYVDAATRMRDPLEAHGTLETTLSYLKWSYHYDEQVFGDGHRESMDYFHNEALRLLRISLAHGDPVTRWHHVERFRRTLGKQLVASIKPDGGIFHHGFHYFAYGSMGMNSVSGALAAMSKAGLPVAEEGLDAVRAALVSMAWYSGRTTLWSLSGRNPSGTQAVPAGAFLSLARAYAPYRDGHPDPELVAHYLRFHPDQAGKPEFEGVAPAPAPRGHRTMPSAALGMHRREHWLAGIKGYSKYAASGESYANANRHGLYMSMGQLELLTHPKPLPTVHGSGTRPNEGYDWCAIEGATTIHAPLDRIANGNGTRIPRSGETFVGGLSTGGNGLFALRYRNHFTQRMTADGVENPPKPEPLTALKTWFFFDNRIVCLGSDIHTRNVAFPVRTNLFQKFLTEEFDTTVLDGEPLILGDTTLTRDRTDATTLVDPYGNAYFTPDDTPVHLRIGRQSSRDGNDKQDTTGSHATAWIEHGIDPRDDGYEYAVLVQPTGPEVEAFAAARPYSVLKRDAEAHMVHDEATGTTGFVVFDAKATLPAQTPLVSVDQPCLVMIEEHDDQLFVALADPNVRPDAAGAAELRITLRGEWQGGAADGLLLAKEGNTLLTVPAVFGESVVLTLWR